jgi:hypothetical protein
MGAKDARWRELPAAFEWRPRLRAHGARCPLPCSTDVLVLHGGCMAVRGGVAGVRVWGAWQVPISTLEHTVMKLYLEDFHTFCLSLGGGTAEVRMPPPPVRVPLPCAPPPRPA